MRRAMRHLSIVPPTLLAVCLALLASCVETTDLAATDPASPGLDPDGQSVDGLIVGHRLMASGEHELALRAYFRAAGELGLTVDVLSALGSANLKLGRLGQAETLLRQATEKEADFAPAWNNLGVVLMERGKAAEAARVFRIAYGLDSGKTDAIRDNLTLALAKVENISYDASEDATFALMRRGQGDYLLLAQQ
jgi:Flp pilus assembly protein TadD